MATVVGSGIAGRPADGRRGAHTVGQYDPHRRYPRRAHHDPWTDFRRPRNRHHGLCPRRELRLDVAWLYVIAQVVGGIAGTFPCPRCSNYRLSGSRRTARTGTEPVACRSRRHVRTPSSPILAGLRFTRMLIPWLVTVSTSPRPIGSAASTSYYQSGGHNRPRPLRLPSAGIGPRPAGIHCASPGHRRYPSPLSYQRAQLLAETRPLTPINIPKREAAE